MKRIEEKKVEGMFGVEMIEYAAINTDGKVVYRGGSRRYAEEAINPKPQQSEWHLYPADGFKNLIDGADGVDGIENFFPACGPVMSAEIHSSIGFLGYSGRARYTLQAGNMVCRMDVVSYPEGYRVEFSA